MKEQVPGAQHTGAASQSSPMERYRVALCHQKGQTLLLLELGLP